MGAIRGRELQQDKHELENLHRNATPVWRGQGHPDHFRDRTLLVKNTVFGVVRRFYWLRPAVPERSTTRGTHVLKASEEENGTALRNAALSFN